jgi:hypothetical protein
MKIHQIRPQFSEFIPDKLEEGVLYISERYKTASHKCACGCGEEVVTPLSPVEWQLRKEGGFVSLHPSIGNWNYACRSHYWIRRNAIQWAGSMSAKQIALVQAKDKADKTRYVGQINRLKDSVAQTTAANSTTGNKPSWITKALDTLIQWLKGR